MSFNRLSVLLYRFPLVALAQVIGCAFEICLDCTRIVRILLCKSEVYVVGAFEIVERQIMLCHFKQVEVGVGMVRVE